MLARRSRLQIKPNIAKASKSIPKPTEKPVEVASPSLAEAEPNEQPTISEVATTTTPLEVVEVSVSMQGLQEQAESSKTLSFTTQNPDPIGESEVGYVDPLAPQRRIAHTTAYDARSRLSSTTDYSDSLTTKPSRQRRRFTGDEELDPKKMRMVDMIYWNPKKEKGMSRKNVETESVIGETPRKPAETSSAATGAAKVVAPQVKIGADGRLVIDEGSLVIANEDTNDSIWETVEEDRVSRKVTSLSFRNRLWRKGTSWTEKENELFYEILRCTGPDFGLMHEFFPTRTRNELKSKFNREERTNWAKLKEVMSRPALLDDDLYDRAADLQKEIEQEALKKKMKKEKVTITRRKRKNKNKGKDAEESEQSDVLVEEAEEIIRALEDNALPGKKKRKRFWSYFSESDSSGSNGGEESDPEENEENLAEQTETPGNNAENDFENASMLEKGPIKKRRENSRIQAVSVEGKQPEQNAEKQPQQVQLRTRKQKKLSAKAQTLLDETLKQVESSKAHGDERVNDRLQEVQSTSQQTFDGYEEEGDDLGSIQSIDTDIIEDKRRPNLLVRTRRTAEVIMTSKPIERSQRSRTNRVSDHEEAMRAHNHHEDEQSATSSRLEPLPETMNSQEDKEFDALPNRHNEDILSPSSAEVAMAPVPADTQLSRPRRAAKARTLPNRILRGKRPSVNVKAANATKKASVQTSNKAAILSLKDSEVPTRNPSNEPMAETTAEEVSISVFDIGRKTRSLDNKKQSKTVPPAWEEQSQDSQKDVSTVKNTEDASTTSNIASCEEASVTATSATKKGKSSKKFEEIALKRPQAKFKRGRGRFRGGQ